ncbi:hypothetical protein ERX37_06060 [Macrococcus hajekii]|uniref:ABC transporter permease n=1 Tax=Macrococcus hajekii TaxID=198482 RepID=A0A4R6BJ98_9STAP|nr:hypothetical protein [Macrococcus hajekii]TDM01772.1 hypothetical protein ERX37_06060 [Macrococcus hajekii]GGB07316.1 ABC transporter permease [Macrococcus hajekii]
MKMNRILAIAEKDFKEFMRNMMLLTMPLLPIILAAMYSNMPFDEMEGGREFIAIILMGMALGAVLTSAMMTMLAEENEKHTLRGLINSPATMIDILVGKSLVVTVMMILSVIISLINIKVNIFTDYKMVLGFIGLYLFFLFLGIGVGLIVRSVSETSLYLLPILFVFAMSPMFRIFLGIESSFLKVMKYLPLSQYMELAENGGWMPVIIIFIWSLLAFLVMALLFRKVRTD